MADSQSKKRRRGPYGSRNYDDEMKLPILSISKSEMDTTFLGTTLFNVETQPTCTARNCATETRRDVASEDESNEYMELSTAEMVNICFLFW